MNESYAEAGVRRKSTASSYLIKAGIVVLILLMFTIGSVFLGQFGVLIASILIVLAVYLFPRFNVEYEYVFCDGQLDFDKIMGNSKRKNALRIDFDKVEIMAPANSHALDGYTYQQLKVKDFSSLRSDAKVYAVVVRDNESLLKVLFEPNEKMINCIKQKAPRKVSDC